MQNDESLGLPFVTRKMLDFENASTFKIVIEITANPSAATSITIQGATKQGPFKFLCEIAAGAPKQSLTFAIPDFPIILSLIQSSTAAFANGIWAMVKLSINGDIVAILTQGYINNSASIAWPEQQREHPLDKFGTLQIQLPAAPAVNTEWTITVPAQQRWEILSIYSRLVTVIAAANRRPILKVTTSGLPHVFIPTPADIVANTQVKVIYQKNALGTIDLTNLIQTVPLPDQLIVNSGDIISSETTNMQGGDRWYDIVIRAGVFFI